MPYWLTWKPRVRSKLSEACTTSKRGSSSSSADAQRIGPVDLGAFDEDELLELIGGQLIVAEPKGSEHAIPVRAYGDRVGSAVRRGCSLT